MMKRRNNYLPGITTTTSIDPLSSPSGAHPKHHSLSSRSHGVQVATSFLKPMNGRQKTAAVLVLVLVLINFLCNVFLLGGPITLLTRTWTKISYTLPMLQTYGTVHTPTVPSYQSYLNCLKDPHCKRFPYKNNTLPHDYPGHPWHWARENDPDPVLSQKRDCNKNLYLDLYNQFHQEGFVVFESCSLKHSNILEQVAAYTRSLHKKEHRVQNAPHRAVQQLAVDPDTLEFLEYLHGGRSPFPYQTLNFPTGTQQALHSDLIHFDTSPRTLMTAAWVALEDMNLDNGPLQYVPKSHLYGTWDYDEIGLHHKVPEVLLPYTGDEQELYGQELRRMVIEQAGLEIKVADQVKKGQTFVWAAGLVHGGSIQTNQELTRLSQVSHYFFEGADFYWHPRSSNRAKGQIKYITDPTTTRFHRCRSTPKYVVGRIHSCAAANRQSWLDNCYEKSFFGMVKTKCPALDG